MYNINQSCTPEISKNFLRNCNHRPKAGVLRKWIGFHEGIDQQATNLSKSAATGFESKFAFDQFVLNSSSFLYRLEGNDKVHKVKHEFTPGDFANGYTHTDTVTFIDRNQTVLMNIADIQDGRFFTISEMVDAGGDGKTKFLVAGAFSGMKLLSDNFDSGENSGTLTIELATKEGDVEPFGLLPLLIGGDQSVTPVIEASPETTLEALKAMEFQFA